ncbi:hypothetical protein [Pedobacter chitinilyticus]|uniref:Lipoprotein n=1 Tax=Pedobacter chitinilyticus TaxID=2233776 RepID=A0A443Z2A9_9SPHI|nr:hypothetical protein [Pedobacter chitinilyticus]RWU10645.1 hypothetical protein DPV69_04715 [Pedobacter chitinilyticus]
MRKLILSATALLLATVTISCKDKKTEGIEKMTDTINKHIDDGLFKENVTTTLREVTFLSVDTLTENTLDTLRQVKNQEKIDNFLSETRQYQSLMKNELSQMRLQKSLGWTVLFNNTKNDFEEHQGKAKALLDSINAYENTNQKIKNRIKTNKNPKPVYEMKMLIKLTMNKGNESHNLLDTSFYHFNESFVMLRQ